MYKYMFFALLLVVSLMCSTQEERREVAFFIKICDQFGQDCEVYFPTKQTTVDTKDFNVSDFVENHRNAFFGEKSASYDFLTYLSKDTITILIQK